MNHRDSEFGKLQVVRTSRSWPGPNTPPVRMPYLLCMLSTDIFILCSYKHYPFLHVAMISRELYLDLFAQLLLTREKAREKQLFHTFFC